LRAQLAQTEPPGRRDELNEKRLERRLLDLAEGWQGWIGKHPPLARQALRAMLVGPIQHVERDGYRLKGVTRLGALFDGETASAWRPHGDSNPGHRRERAITTNKPQRNPALILSSIADPGQRAFSPSVLNAAS
jgi:hypothetical protein